MKNYEAFVNRFQCKTAFLTAPGILDGGSKNTSKKPAFANKNAGKINDTRIDDAICKRRLKRR